MEKIEKKKVTPTLRSMEIGAEETFPIEQAGSIASILYSPRLAVERASGKKWSLSTNMDDRTVKITRIS